MSRAIIVVPCYNEAKRLNLSLMQEFGRGTLSTELLLVNDGSRDETLELIERLHVSNPRRFSFLHLAKNSGKAEAVRQGLLLALVASPNASANRLRNWATVCRGRLAISWARWVLMRTSFGWNKRKPLRTVGTIWGTGSRQFPGNLGDTWPGARELVGVVYFAKNPGIIEELPGCGWPG